MSKRKGILERLEEGPVIGDGSICFTLEKRGYCKAGAWTPEAVVEFPEAVKQLQREYLRAGADVMQTASFYGSDDKLTYGKKGHEHTISTEQINDAACRIATEVAEEGGALVCGSLSPVPSFAAGLSSEIVTNEFMKQVHVYEEHKVDFVLGEFFADVEEAEIAIQAMKRLNIPIACTMRIGPVGDEKGVSVEECAVRMAKAGAHIIGLNCMHDPNTILKCMRRMKQAIDRAGLKTFLMCQPLGYYCPEAEDDIGYVVLPEAPFCLEGRQLTRIDAHKYARAAWEIGVRYIGGCCGMEPHHIRALAQELIAERGGLEPPCQDYCEEFGGKLMKDSFFYSFRHNREYWYDVKVGSGRPFNPPLTHKHDLCYECDADKLFHHHDNHNHDKE